LVAARALHPIFHEFLHGFVSQLNEKRGKGTARLVCRIAKGSRMETLDQSLRPITRGLTHSIKLGKADIPFAPNRNFRLFWLGDTCATFGDAIAFIAFPLLVLQATGSVAQMGVVTALLGIGRLLASLLAGGIVDRLNRHLLLCLCALNAAVCYALIPVVWAFVGPTIPLLYIIAAPIGAFGALIQVAGTAFLPEIVNPFHLTAANSRVQTTGAIAFLGGPFVAGLLSARYGPPVAVALESFAYLVFLWLLLPIQSRRARSARSRMLATNDAFAGLRFLWQDPLLRWVVLLNAAQISVLAGIVDLFIFLLKHELHQSDVTLGVFFGGAAFGALIAGLIVPWLQKRLGFGVCFLGGLLLDGIVLSGFGLTTNLYIFVALGVGFILGDTIILIASQVIQQERTPTRLLGRVTAAYQVLIALGSALGAAATTALAARLGTVSVITGIGAGIVALAVLGLFTPARQRADSKA
jgi:MFS family permease